MAGSLNLIFYGRLAETIAPTMELDAAAACSIAELRGRLAVEHPEAAETLASKRSRALVGAIFVGEDHVIRPGDRIEFLSPVSGG
jgi:molybdopterin converting factor small subunit